MIIKERHEIVIEKHPYYESLNKKLMKDLESLEFFTPDTLLKYTNVQGLQTISVEEKDRTSSMVLVLEWVTQLLTNHIGFSLRAGAAEFGGKVKYNMWFAKYNKGDYTKIHQHLPAALFGFVYFVNSPLINPFSLLSKPLNISDNSLSSSNIIDISILSLGSSWK